MKIRTTTGGTFFAHADDLEAARRGGDRDVPLCLQDGSPIPPGGRARLRLTTIERSDPQPVAPELAQRPEAQVQEPTATPLRSMLAQVGRWISGAARREREAAEAQAHAKAQAAAAQTRAEAERQAQAERAKAQAEAARVAQVASVEAAATTTEPLIRVETLTGGIYHVLTTDYTAARAAGARDVPLVDWRGDSVGEGERTQLPLTTIEASVLKPLPIIAADSYVVAAGEAQAQDGPTIGM